MTGANAYFFFWAGQFMYIGKTIDTSTHDHHAIQLALSFDHPFFIKTPEGAFKKVMAVIIDSDQAHECRTNDNHFLLLNIDPMTTIGKALKKIFLTRQAVAELPPEITAPFLQTIGKHLGASPFDSDLVHDLTREYVYGLCAMEEDAGIDERIRKVMRLLEEKKGDTLKVKVLEIDPEKERVSLGVKQLTAGGDANAAAGGASAAADGGVAKNAVVTCTVTAVTPGGIEVSINDNLKGFIKKNDLSRERSEQRPDRFAVGEKVDAKVIKTGRQLELSIKAREIEEDKQAMAEYGSSDSGASLGDILGAALQKKGAKAADASEEAPKKAKKAKTEE